MPLGPRLRPYWVDDGTFDVEYHVRELALPAPGDNRQLAEQVARIISRPLDRSRPLWELYVIEGLEDGAVALLTKMHHAAVDGDLRRRGDERAARRHPGRTRRAASATRPAVER